MTNSLVFKAILSMDSYNRGYNPGVKDNANGMGGVSNSEYALGNAKFIRESNETQNPGAVAAGFYASAYQLESGEVIISYRGTDGSEAVASGSDLYNGYGIGTGSPYGSDSQVLQ